VSYNNLKYIYTRMQQAITIKFVALFALVAMAFAAAVPAYAYDEL
jgi:hypothetical protein